jgi:hypothetical protein
MTSGNDFDSQYSEYRSHSTPLRRDDPPPTEPTLPPIRSAQPEASRGPTSRPLHADRAVVAAHDSVRRDVMAAMQEKHGGSIQPIERQIQVPDEDRHPLIISGTGKPTPSHQPILRRTRPRSRALNAALIALSICSLMAIFYAATPLSAGAAGRGNPFVGGVSAFALPTSTPTPTPPPVSAGNAGGNNGYTTDPGSAAIIADIQNVFGATYSPGAINVARCESGFNPNARNTIAVLGSHAEGIFQILYPITWQSTSQAASSPYDAAANVRAAHEIFVRDGYSWKEWSCRP